MKSDALILDNYLKLINRLPEEDKLEIIIRLSKMLQTKQKNDRKSAPKANISLFGALNDRDSAEAWIERIRSARTFNRSIEPL